MTEPKLPDEPTPQKFVITFPNGEKLCDCDRLSEKCKLGRVRPLHTAEFGRCLLPAEPTRDDEIPGTIFDYLSHDDLDDCPLWHDGCNCSDETLLARDASTRIARLQRELTSALALAAEALAVIGEILEWDGSVGAYSAIKNYDAHEKARALLSKHVKASPSAPPAVAAADPRASPATPS